MEFVDPIAALTAAKTAAQEARLAAVKRLETLDIEKAKFLEAQATERKLLVEALRTRAFVARKTKALGVEQGEQA